MSRLGDISAHCFVRLDVQQDCGWSEVCRTDGFHELCQELDVEAGDLEVAEERANPSVANDIGTLLYFRSDYLGKEVRLTAEECEQLDFLCEWGIGCQDRLDLSTKLRAFKVLYDHGSMTLAFEPVVKKPALCSFTDAVDAFNFDYHTLILSVLGMF